MSSRLHTTSTKNKARRIHTHVPADWLKAIDAAAKKCGITRANFMATSSHAAAQKILATAKAEKAAK